MADITPQKPDPKLIALAQAQAREIILEAKDEVLKLKDQARQESVRLSREIDQKRQLLFQDKQEIARLQARLEERDRLTAQQSQIIQTRLKEIEELKIKQIKALEKVSDMSQTQAKEQVLAEVAKRSTAEAAKLIKASTEKAHEEAEVKAKEILVDAMYSGATDYVAEYTVTTVKIPDEETKGRIIGKEGRNIRTFEKVTGVDIDLDEQGVIKLSCFDSIRRETARVALERLIKDGRIHPTHIEEFVDKARRDIDKYIFQEGERLCHSVGVYDLPRDIIAALGKFKYRTSYGQNMIAHTLEETRIGIKLASEAKANVEIVKLGCLLHDIGKVITDEEGSHVELGVRFLKKYNIPQAAIDCVAQHHEDEEFTSIESVLVYISDAISGSRPGARYENYEEYVQRLQKLEEIATKHAGVKDAFAIQAGREIRVIVDPRELNDDLAAKLALDIKDEVKASMTYPGTITVTVIRETRNTQVAA
ncbi:ribonuclease Y [Candidatus Collierbacteria bacterium RIFOXYB1_FULL_49_13]|uniref:Ribonuclease Y n=1 Tax=Candidatus Collierbacteria bacterium RIFOXYB1_FULL_49_13 TaxID=1817728 RepID=A0A1F5FHS9_9BACT|nr:MAG: ribonuclease Y [Candidatus Collierbacteria bacterium RIFOXYB1_FULL_49_13]